MNEIESGILRVLASAVLYGIVQIAVLRVFGSGRLVLKSIALLVPFLAVPTLDLGEKFGLLSLWNILMIMLICARNSVSLRILEELRTAPSQEMPQKLLLEKFSDAESLEARLSLLARNGWILRPSISDAELTPSGFLLAKTISQIQRAFGVTNPG